jgi:hypothetical protein
MTKCSQCGNGIKSTYIREGSKGIAHKLGYYCFTCDAYYDLSSEKLYTVNTKTVYSGRDSKKLNLSLSLENKEPWPGFGPGTFALPRQRSTRLSYQGANAP